MTDSSTSPAAGSLKAGRTANGFMIESVTSLSEIRCLAYQALHEKSGARLLHLHSNDPENLFAVGFKTPPPDDTGLPHILEHTVLCGSEKYPVKDPFIELLKTSLATFLNAMTYPDRTIYPCASMNVRDFFNLASVYLDSVFHPLIDEERFKQEGHHLELTRPGDLAAPLTVKGVVYNEMKGAYSGLDGIIERELTKKLIPDNAYGRDYGGDPDAIPGLTYEKFRDFHRTYYRPANSLIFLYGNIPTEKHLAFLGPFLDGFRRTTTDVEIAEQPRWTEPRRSSIPYPIGPGENAEKKAAVVLAYLAGANTDPLRTLSDRILSHYLIGNAASPLRQALIDSKLGEELTDSGYFHHQRDTFFTVGLKGTEAERSGAVEEVIRKTCSRIVREGLERKKLEACLHQLDLFTREVPNLYPLKLMDRAFESWAGDGDLFRWLKINDQVRRLRRKWRETPVFFEDRLRELLLDNRHYAVLTFVPDAGYLAARERRFRQEMEARKSALSRTELKTIAREAEELEAAQSAPIPPETAALLPRLSRADVPPEATLLPTSREEAEGRPCLATDLFSNGLSYVTLAFDLRGLNEELSDYLPLFCEALPRMGAGESDYAATAEREAACSGGVEATPIISGRIDDPFYDQPVLTVSSKALDRKLPAMLALLADRVLRCDFTDRDRLRDVIIQGRVARRSGVIRSGNSYAASFAARRLSNNCALKETWKGLTQIRFFDRLAENFDAESDLIVDRLSAIREFLIRKDRLTSSILGRPASMEKIRRWLEGLLREIDRGPSPPPDIPAFTPGPATKEGVAVPADVAFVATAIPAAAFTEPAGPALFLLSSSLSYGYLWEEVRVKGGAYGCSASYNPANGTFSLASYRDPSIKQTLEVYYRLPGYLKEKMDLSPKALEQAVIGSFKKLDRPIRPEEAVGTALLRYLRGETDEERNKFRERLLALRGEDIRRASEEVLSPSLSGAPVCVLANREKLEEAGGFQNIFDL